jgi:multiple sugar transport system permease protein
MKRTHLGLWLLPAALPLAIVTVYPIVRTLILSVSNLSLINGFHVEFAGLANFVRLFSDFRFLNTLTTTLFFTATSVLIEFVCGFALAVVVGSLMGPARVVRALLIVPWTLPTAIAALLWTWLLNDQYGIINRLLTYTRLTATPVAWLASPDTAMSALIIADVWKTVPFVFLILLAGLRTIPADLYEAVEIDGGGFWAGLRYVTWPGLRVFIYVAVIFRVIQAFAVFDLVYVMTGGGPGGSTETVSVYAYQTYMRYLDFGYGSAVVVASVVVLALTAGLLYMLLLRRHEDLA